MRNQQDKWSVCILANALTWASIWAYLFACRLGRGQGRGHVCTCSGLGAGVGVGILALVQAWARARAWACVCVWHRIGYAKVCKGLFGKWGRGTRGTVSFFGIL